MRVVEIMMGTPYHCSPEANLGSATELMWIGNCGFLPVVGKDNKLAAHKPKAASKVVQQKIISRPRAKLTPKPDSGYKTSIPSSRGKSNAVLLGLPKATVRTPFSSKRLAGIGNSWKVSGARLMVSLSQS